MSALGSLGSLVLQGIGFALDYEENEDAQRYARYINEAELSLRERTLSSQIEENKAKLAFEKHESLRKWKWLEEQQQYKQGQDFLTNFRAVLDKDPLFRNNLVQIWQTGGRQ